MLARPPLLHGTPRPCPDGRFPLVGSAPLGTDGQIDTVVLERGMVRIDDLCPPVAARVQVLPRSTRVRARWKSCPGLPGRVFLRARMRAPECNLLEGALRVKPRPHRRPFAAARGGFVYDVPLDPASPWPKFRRNSRQNGRSPLRPAATGGHLWTFPTAKGIFSTPVIDGAGNVYVGSADRTFYALAADGSVRWRLLTGEIIDSSALLDDRGRVYFGSGDGRLYARDAATGGEAWTFTADPPAGAFINWFEGNVAMGRDGTLYAPNDNFFTYALDRDAAAVRWRFRTFDQTWSLPAVDARTDRLFMGNNIQLFLDNTFALDGVTGTPVWSVAVDGSVAASPMLTADGAMIVGGFDGFLRAYDQVTGTPRWAFGARDHIYASPAELPDGTVVQPSADGTVYGLDPASGAVRWQFDTRDAIRSSPAVDGDGRVYVGSGEGRLFVLHPDGTLRWSLRLIDGARDDLNASPALGRDAVVVAGESGEIFSVPYDWCLRPEASGDARCRLGPAEDLPSDGAFLAYVTQFGRALETPPAEIEANQPLTFALFVRAGGDTVLAHIDTASVAVTLDPPVPVRTEVSGDRKFLTVIPLARLAEPAGGPLRVTVTGTYLVNPERDGLRFSGGVPGGAFDSQFEFDVRAASAGGPLPLPVPSAPGDPAGVWELSRLAAPLPTILPSYNQIGFDSIHYLIGLVESTADGQAVGWVVGARLAEGANRAVVDPATRVLFPFTVRHDGGLLTFSNEGGFAIEFNAIRIPFELLRIATRIDGAGRALASPAINALTPCAGITFYGPFFQQLGYCNPTTDILNVFGGAELAPHEDGVGAAPSGVGAVAFAADAMGITATLTGSALRPDTQAVGILLVDAASGRPVSLDYGFTTERTANPDGTLATVRVPYTRSALPSAVRAYLMVDTYPAVREAVTLP
jgi:outer membrane protein assembly factor BamB